MQRIVTELPLDSLRFDCASLELDLGDCGGSDLREVLDLVARPLPWRLVECHDEREWLARCPGQRDAEKPGDA